jgi:hypothetical protein
MLHLPHCPAPLTVMGISIVASVCVRLGEFGMKFMDDPSTVDPQVRPLYTYTHTWTWYIYSAWYM